MNNFVKLCNVIGAITANAIRNIGRWFLFNMRYLGSVLDFLLPYAMLFIGQYVYQTRGNFALGGELLVPLAVSFLSYYMHAIPKAYGKGSDVPVPRERFTEVTEDGEVSIDESRLQEMLLYVADLEDCMVRKGMLK